MDKKDYTKKWISDNDKLWKEIQYKIFNWTISPTNSFHIKNIQDFLKEDSVSDEITEKLDMQCLIESIDCWQIKVVERRVSRKRPKKISSDVC